MNNKGNDEKEERKFDNLGLRKRRWRKENNEK